MRKQKKVTIMCLLLSFMMISSSLVFAGTPSLLVGSYRVAPGDENFKTVYSNNQFYKYKINYIQLIEKDCGPRKIKSLIAILYPGQERQRTVTSQQSYSYSFSQSNSTTSSFSSSWKIDKILNISSEISNTMSSTHSSTNSHTTSTSHTEKLKFPDQFIGKAYKIEIYDSSNYDLFKASVTYSPMYLETYKLNNKKVSKVIPIEKRSGRGRQSSTFSGNSSNSGRSSSSFSGNSSNSGRSSSRGRTSSSIYPRRGHSNVVSGYSRRPRPNGNSRSSYNPSRSSTSNYGSSNHMYSSRNCSSAKIVFTDNTSITIPWNEINEDNFVITHGSAKSEVNFIKEEKEDLIYEPYFY